MVDALYSRGCLEARLYLVLSFSPALPIFPIVSQPQRMVMVLSEPNSEGLRYRRWSCRMIDVVDDSQRGSIE